MRKTSIIFFIALSSLIIMACSISSFTQQTKQTGTSNIEATEEASILPTSIPTKELLAEVDSGLTKEVVPTLMIEKTPTPTVDPLLSSKSCLARTWEINGLSDYVVSSVPPELAEQYSLEYEDTTGQAFLTFSPDDEIILRAENLEFLFKAQIAIFKVPVTVSIDGITTGTYSLDKTKFTAENMDTSGLTASAKAMDEDMIEPDQIIESIPFVRPPFNTAEYSCQGDILELDLSGYSEDLPPLIFKAVD